MPDLLSLLESQKYADLTLKCGQETVLVHKAILCSQSEMLAKACSGCFTESATDTVEISIIDFVTLLRMLVFLYSNQYHVVFEFRGVVYGCEDLDERELNSERIGSTDSEKFDRPEASESQDEVARPEHSEEVPAPCTTNPRLITHAKMYAAADYYQISSLKQYAIEQFKRDIEDFHARGFGRVVEYVFQSTPDSDTTLRQIVIENAATHGKALIDEADFLQHVSALQDFLTLFVVSFAKRLGGEHTKMEEKLDAVERERNSLRAENNDLTGLGRRLVKLLECRHCHVKGNGTTAQIGRRWIARCSCGTYFN